MRDPDAILRGLAAVSREWRKCDRCRLVESSSKVVQWRGAPGARLLLAGEGPGADEDRVGEPFVGRAGALLDELAERAGLPIDQHAIVINVVGCRPPKNRAPKADEVRACKPRVDELVVECEPAAALVMGATAHRWFGGRSSSLSAVRGERFDIVRPLLVEGARPLAIPAVSTWHPAYILRLRAERRREAEDEFVADFRLAAELAGEWL